jgi:FKBP-type peptidyl-prolyl cis-trans isomerase
MEKLHNEIMPDLMAWQKEKNRKRFPEGSPSQANEDEKPRKTEKRKSEEKENIVEGVHKKPKKEVEIVKDTTEIGSKITLLVTGADPSFLDGNYPKVRY